MYTPTNAYQRKFSSGLIVALLALSGALLLVPLAATTNASNSSSSYTLTSSHTVLSGTGSTTVTLTIDNPATNHYAITGFTISMPSGWSVSGTPVAATFTTCSVTSTSVQCTGGDSAPGIALVVTGLSIAGPTVSSYPASGKLTTTIQDASSNAFYSGPSLTLYEVDSSGTLTVALSPSSTTFTAGGSPYTVTATLLDSSSAAEVGVPVVWTVGGTGSGTVTAISSMTNSNGVATATFTPSNTAGDSNFAVATLGVNTPEATASTATVLSTASAAVTTQAGPPSEVTFLISTESSNYLRTEATTSSTSTTYPSHFTGAELTTSQVTYSVADKFGNAIAFTASTLTINSITISALSGGGVFDGVTATTLPSTVSCSAHSACIASPWGTGTAVSGNLPYNYFQSPVYGAVGQLSATISGTYGPSASAFTVAGNSGTATTSTFAASSPQPAVSTTAPKAGSSISVYATLPTVQQGVPINIAFYLPGTGQVSLGDGLYSGQFTNGMHAITLTTNSSGMVQTSFSIDNVEGATVEFVANVTAPIYGTPTNELANSTVPNAGGTAVTAAGPAASFAVNTYFYASGAPPTFTSSTTSVVSSGTLYLDATLVDAYGNTVTLSSNANTIQVNLAATAGTLSATSVYITAGHSDTGGSFGAVIYTAPSSTGSLTIKASGVVAGKAVTGTSTITVVSAKPTLFVTSPLPVSGAIYSTTTPMVFHGNASVSTGYPTTGASADTISQVCYTAGTQSACQAESTSPVTWAMAVNVGAGLHTISFNATDANGNTISSATYQVLVDTTAPNINFATANNANVSSPAKVSANIVDTEGDLNASSVTAVATNLKTSATKTLTATVTGTNSLGSSVTYGVSISGLTTGNWTVKLSASDLAGNSNSSTITVHVTVPFAQSFVVSGTPHSATIGSFTGINASYTNLNPTSQSVVVFAVFKNSAGQTMGIGTGSLTVGAGATQSVFIAEPVGLASGTYSVSIFVFTTGNLPVSVSTSISVTV